MCSRLLARGHTVVVYDIEPRALEALVAQGAHGVSSISELASTLSTPRFIWIMVQRGSVQGVLDSLMPHLAQGDTIVDGGNTFFKETMVRAQTAAGKGISYMDVGVSGGVTAAREGACLMIGGPLEAFEQHLPLFMDMAQEKGFGYMGNSGAGHFVKMVHNGIEYGMMQAIAEGIETIDVHKTEFGIDMREVLQVYTHGSIVSSSLMNWLVRAWEKDPGLSSVEGIVPRGDTEAEMRELQTLSNMPALRVAIEERERSREKPRFAGKIIAALRNQFGSHAVTSIITKKS
jgi:6-phosphogluconate dehydrogenase